MYRQVVTVEDLDKNGTRLGEYREVTDVIFSPGGDRTQQQIEKPRNTLRRLILSPEDMRDIREIQPILITRETLFLYEGVFRGSEEMDGIECWVVRVRPRQILAEQRYFDGLIWADKRDYSIVRVEGKAVPQIQTTKHENLFPHFTTMRRVVDGKCRFPFLTYAEDTLYFRSGPQRMRMRIQYENYKRFSAESRIDYK